MKINTTSEILTIDPKTASEWLQNRWGDQRPVRVGHVQRLVSDMLNDRFRVSPDAILRVSGKLANGQHRLEAVVQANKSQTFLVMQSNDDELYKVIDSGLKRTASDSLIGIPYAQNMPAIARWVQSYESQNFSPMTRKARGNRENGKTSLDTQVAIIEYCLEHQRILGEAAQFVVSIWVESKLLPISMGAALYVLASRRKLKESVQQFLQSVYVTGGDNVAGDLRNKLTLNRSSRNPIPQGYVFGILIKSFRSYCNGTRPGILKWAKDEAFPVL